MIVFVVLPAWQRFSPSRTLAYSQSPCQLLIDRLAMLLSIFSLCRRRIELWWWGATVSVIDWNRVVRGLCRLRRCFCSFYQLAGLLQKAVDRFRKPVAPPFIDIRLAASVYLVRKAEKVSWHDITAGFCSFSQEICAFSERFHLQYYYLRVTCTERYRYCFWFVRMCGRACVFVSALKL